MKRAILVLVVLAVLAAVVWSVRRGSGQPAVHYRLVSVEQGDLDAVVSTTGHLEPVVTVQVGTQVSGIIDAIYVDFNDQVRAGQVIARIDTTLLSSAVASAAAQRERTRAELRHAEREYTRLSSLWRENLVAETEYHTAIYALDVARAAVAGADVEFDRARRNLAYATVTAPIAGTVISRAVDPGQTVQASFSAPELFVIAGDLGAMQILAAVDESDIGQIVPGQVARFTVQAHPDDVFTGTVRQVRLSGNTTENVVTYTVVVDVANPDLRLLPGMTATVDFLVATAKDMLYVANAALRYRPPDAIMQAAIERRRAAMQAERAAAGDSGGPAAGGNTGHSGPGSAVAAGVAPGAGAGAAADAAPARAGQPSTGPSSDRGMLWIVQPNGQLDVLMVRTGITNGTSTVVQGRGLAAGLQVVAGTSSQPVAASATATPFQPAGGAPRGGPRIPGGF
ncbi:MAG: efflux RND transporter periplasmic adaptor subunit [Candidatus Krumholzibacteria bacterium]|jgi:HlyD family secretion protein|nr:efflux RND transporter periplasmic adaptor subunit [Candidatus Krumholzibacteria bacterium]